MKQIDVKLDTYRVLSEIVEAGVEQGFERAHKVTDGPSEQTIKEHVASSVMMKLEQYLAIS